MTAIRVLLSGILVLLTVSCGQIVKEVPPVTSIEPQSAPGLDKTIVVLPFADYSYGDDVETAYMRNLIIMETLTDKLVACGFKMPVQEDVFEYLANNQFIKSIAYDQGLRKGGKTSGLESELDWDWSELMKNEIKDMLNLEQARNFPELTPGADPMTTPGTHGLDKRGITKIGHDFGADYVMRGRIIKYNLRQGNTWEPLRTGILPFFYGASNRMMFGFARSEEYDTISSMATGGMIGAIVGNNVTSPFDLPKKVVQTTGTSDTAPIPFGSSEKETTVVTKGGTSDATIFNELVWGAAGAATAYLAEQGGDTPEAVVQLRIWVQDPSTYEVVWTNRAEVAVAPESVFADRSPDSLFETAVNKAITALMDDFRNKFTVN